MKIFSCESYGNTCFTYIVCIYCADAGTMVMSKSICLPVTDVMLTNNPLLPIVHRVGIASLYTTSFSINGGLGTTLKGLICGT